jgi:hypothetical protein
MAINYLFKPRQLCPAVSTKRMVLLSIDTAEQARGNALYSFLDEVLDRLEHIFILIILF